MQRRMVILTAATAAVVVGVVAVIVVLSVRAPVSPAEQTSAAAPTPGATVQIATPDPGEAHEVAQALQRLSTDPESVVAAQARGQVGADAGVAVPPAPRSRSRTGRGRLTGSVAARSSLSSLRPVASRLPTAR